MGMCPAVPFFMVSVDNMRWTKPELRVFAMPVSSLTSGSSGHNIWQNFSTSSPHRFLLVYCTMSCLSARSLPIEDYERFAQLLEDILSLSARRVASCL